MKIQHIAVVFIIIMIPIITVTSLYIRSEIDTITLQSKYNTKLSVATYDSVIAFQINTVNNRYSSVSDSKIRDIEAAVNTFFNSLGNSEALTKKSLQDYVPALVYTLYDGYYICSKYDNVYPENNGKPILDENVLKSNDPNYGLKTYIYYSCRYIKGNSDFIVNYTLDNAINIYGKINGNYKTLSGYLINPDSVEIITDGDDPLSWKLKYNGIVIEKEILSEHIAFSDETSGDFEYLEHNGQKIYLDKGPNENYFYYNNYNKTYLVNATLREYLSKRTSGGHLYSTSAFEFYYNAKKFSEEVSTLIGDITQEHAVDSENNPIDDFAVDTGSNPIFKASASNDPLLSGSTFNENRMSAIRKSIETNLTAAIANYNLFSSNTYEFRMPKLSEIDWGKITNNVSVMTFLQGIPIGHKYYNNYCVITNNNNEEVVKKENIYIVTQNNSSGDREYHLVGCPHLMQTNLTSENIKIVGAYANTSFLRQTVRISEGDYRYFYPQNLGNNKNITSCYYCIVNAANTYDIDQVITGKIIGKDSDWQDEQITDGRVRNLGTIRALYLRALARERYDLYQANVDAFNN